MSEDLISLLKELGVVIHEKTKFRGGHVSDYYVNVKRAYGDRRALDLICEEFWKILDRRTTCIASMDLGGIPLAIAMQQKYMGIKACGVRNKEKKYGRKGLLEYYIPTEDDYVTFADDVFSTGGTLMEIDERIRPTGAEVVGAFTVVAHSIGGPSKLRFPLRSLINAEELL